MSRRVGALGVPGQLGSEKPQGGLTSRDLFFTTHLGFQKGRLLSLWLTQGKADAHLPSSPRPFCLPIFPHLLPPPPSAWVTGRRQASWGPHVGQPSAEVGSGWRGWCRGPVGTRPPGPPGLGCTGTPNSGAWPRATHVAAGRSQWPLNWRLPQPHLCSWPWQGGLANRSVAEDPAVLRFAWPCGATCARADAARCCPPPACVSTQTPVSKWWAGRSLEILGVLRAFQPSSHPVGQL